MVGPAPGGSTLPAGSDEALVRERRRDYARWYVAVGAEAVVLALLIVVVGRQLWPVLGAAAPDGAEAAWVHDLLVEARGLLARVNDTDVWTWVASVLAWLLTVTGPWLRRPAARWSLPAAVVGGRSTPVVVWLVVAALPGLWGWS